MTTNHHTAIANGAALDDTTFNNPNGQLDSAITNTLDATQEFSGLLSGSGSLDASAIAEMDSTTKGFLAPRMTNTQRDAITTPATGLLIYSTTDNEHQYFDSSWKTLTGSTPTSGVRTVGGAATLTNNTNKDIIFQTSDRFDTDAYHDLSTNNTRLTVPTGKAGKYLISGHIDIDSPAAAMRVSLWILFDVSQQLIGAQKYLVPTSGGVSRYSIMTVYDLAATEFVELRVHQVSGATRNLNVVGNYSPEFSMILLG